MTKPHIHTTPLLDEREERQLGVAERRSKAVKSRSLSGDHRM